MRRLAAIGGRGAEAIQIVDGPRSRGVFIRPPDQSAPGIEFAHPRLTLRVAVDSLIHSGLIIQGAPGTFLVADHSQTSDYRNHNLFQADRLVSWTRVVTHVDPISRQQVSEAQPRELGKIWVMWQRERQEYADLPIRFSQETTLTATVAPVEIGDMLDGDRVTRMNKALGIRILELQA